jgi:hypothetical protein
MKLLGRDIRPDALLAKLEARLSQRGVPGEPADEPIRMEGVEPRVDPAAFYLSALEAHADPAEPLPLHTHRAGLGRGVLLAKQAFRKVSRFAVVDMFGRQRLFNGYVRDALMEVFGELSELRRAVEALETGSGPKASRPKRTAPKSRTPAAKPKPAEKKKPSRRAAKPSRTSPRRPKK